MENEHQKAVVKTFVVAEILHKTENTTWGKDDWHAMDYVVDVGLRLVIELIKQNTVDTVMLRNHLSQYPQQISTVLADTLHKEKIAVKPRNKPTDEFTRRLTIVSGETFVGCIMAKGIVKQENIVMDADAWQALHDAREVFQNLVLGCIAARTIDLARFVVEDLLEFMQAVMAGSHTASNEIMEAVHEAHNAIKH